MAYYCFFSLGFIDFLQKSFIISTTRIFLCLTSPLLSFKSHKQNRTEFGYAIDKEDIDSAVAHPDHDFPSGSLSDCTITALIHRLTSGAGLTIH